MSTTDPTILADGSPPADPAAPPPAAPAGFVPSDEFKRLEGVVGGLSKMIEQQAQTIQGLHTLLAANVRPAAPEPADPPDVTDDDLDQAILSGSGASKKIRQAVQAELTRLRQTDIEPLRQTGYRAIQNVVRHQAMASMPYYAKFKDEIETQLAKLSPEALTAPQAYVTVHNLVVGQHWPELQREAVEQALRQADSPDAGGPEPGRQTGRSASTSSVPTVRDLLGDQADLAIRSRGLTADEYVRRLGYKSWNDYAKLAISQEGGS